MIAEDAWFRRLALGYLRDPHECAWKPLGGRLVDVTSRVPARHLYSCILCGETKWL